MQRSYSLTFFFVVFCSILWIPLLVPFLLTTKWQISSDFFQGISTSVLQSIVSAVLTLGLGFLFGWSLSCQTRSRRASIVMDFALLLPSFLPSLIVMVGILSIFDFIPFGFWGVVVMNILFEVGLATFLWARLLRHHRDDYTALFILYPKSTWQEQKMILPLLKKESLLLYAVFFLHYLVSLSIPMIMSGGQFVSLEYKMYVILKNSLDWSLVLPFYLFQAFLVIALVFVLPETLKNEHRPDVFNGASKKTFLYGGALVPTAVILWSLLRSFSWETFSQTPPVMYVGTLLIGFLGAGFCFLLLTTLAFFYQDSRFRRPLRFWTIPSLSVVSFSFFSYDFFMSGILGAVLTLVFLFVPTVAKMGLYQRLEDLVEQIEQAQFLGASSIKIFYQIIFPQLAPTISWLSGLSALWMMGDFAMTRLFFTKDHTLALAMQSLMDQYRWSQALYLAWPFLGCCLLVFLFFGGLAYVADQKLK